MSLCVCMSACACACVCAFVCQGLPDVYKGYKTIVMVLRVPVEGRALTALSRVEHDDSRKKH